MVCIELNGKLILPYWAEWLADPPEWFDADFRAMIPRELLVKVPPMQWEEAVEEDGESC